ncbi:replication initiation protein RepC [Ruegeria sp.]|uniref:replication initiation protein RepC n=1 Tax=Ruegeria sp. TaxID=1879320 RepID=UPI003AFFEAE9
MHYPEFTGSYDAARASEIQAFIPREGEHYALPADVTKAQAICAGVEVLRLKGGNAMHVMVLREYADITDRKAWHDLTRAPVNWRRQCDVARKLGIGERYLRKIEKHLEALGFLARATADNGYRGRRSGQGHKAPVQCGISLEPMIANYAAYVGELAAAKTLEAQRQDYVLTVRRAKHRLRKLIESIADAETRSRAEADYADIQEAYTGPSLRTLEEAVLEDIHTRLLDLEDRIRAALTPLTLEPPAPTPGAAQPDREPCPADHTPLPADSPEETHASEAHQGAESPSVENVEKQQDNSAAPELQFRPHIQPEPKPFESCNDLQSKMMTPACAGDRTGLALHPDGRNDCFRNNDRKASLWINPEIRQKLNQNTLKDLASEDAAMYLEVLEDWRDCLPYLLRDLGINISAWLEATDVMGDEIAFIALLVIDRNRFHPVTPVINPGGTLRACTRRAITGELNLTRAILGIWERDRQGKQPKAHPEGRALQ